MPARLQINADAKGRWDVVVAGGGPAGFSAAVAAAERGAKTLLVESDGCLGGQGTGGLLPFWLGGKYKHVPVVGGIYQQMVEQLVQAEATSGSGRCLSQQGRLHGLGITEDEVAYDVEICKQLMDERALKAGVEVLFFTQALMPRVEDGRIVGLFLANKEGVSYVESQVVIDCTGDADIAYRAGFPTEMGSSDSGSLAPVTLIWHAEDVDIAALEAYLNEGGDKRFRQLIKELSAKDVWKYPSDIIVMFPMVRSGVIMLNGQAQVNVDGTDPAAVTKAMILGRRWARDYLEDVLRPYVPGFAQARIRQVASRLGVRETRRIVGEYILRTQDLTAGADFEDTVALSGYHFDLAKPMKQADGHWVLTQPLHKNPNQGQSVQTKTIQKGYAEIPYRSLIPRGSVNLLTAGRCVSAEDQALGPIRVMAPCFAMGQAAGTAAALAVTKQLSVQQVPYDRLRQDLVEDGAILAVGTDQSRGSGPTGP